MAQYLINACYLCTLLLAYMLISSSYTMTQDDMVLFILSMGCNIFLSTEDTQRLLDKPLIMCKYTKLSTIMFVKVPIYLIIICNLTMLFILITSINESIKLFG